VRFSIAILNARPAPLTAAPAVVFQLRIEEIAGARVHAMTLRCQTRIEPRGRRYTNDEQARLYELFGDVSQWDRTLQAVTWAQSSLAVPAFVGRIDVDLAVACTYDLEVASAKYLHAVRDGDIPLTFLFSGTVFSIADGQMTAGPIPWDLEAPFRLPASTWRATMDQFFPGGGWLRLQRETIDRLQAFRGRHAVVSWDDAIALLLEQAAAEEVA
jgi:uncharacterized protein DUF6084